MDSDLASIAVSDVWRNARENLGHQTEDWESNCLRKVEDAAEFCSYLVPLQPLCNTEMSDR